ncbi:MAG: hypothetical protein ACKVQA_21155 [Burkholderiales bacterium]
MMTNQPETGMALAIAPQPQPKFVSKPFGSVPTTWKVKTYDVWGNARDGYEVNDVYSAGEVEIRIPQTKHNVGTDAEFVSAWPTDRQLKRAFGVRCRITTDSDDVDTMNVSVKRERDGYPIGELRCVSHESLSPARRIGEHVWVKSVFTGTTTCANCGLLPVDDDDMELTCEGREVQS